MSTSDRPTLAARVDPTPAPRWNLLASLGWRTCVLLYLMLPVALFAATWVRPLVAIPVVVVLALSIVLQAKRELHDTPRIFGGWLETLLLLGVAIVWVGLSGAGGFGAQNPD